MEGLTGSVDAAAEELRILEGARESAISHSRKVIRLTKVVIHSIHTGADPCEPMSDLRTEVDLMLKDCDDPRVRHSGPVMDALSEFAEAVVFVNLVREGRVPGHREMGIDAGSWIMGLADSIGEMRRMVLTYLTSDDLPAAKQAYDLMEAVFDQVMLMDVPDAIVPLRRKQDIARGIIDRTRSDITTAKIMSLR